MPPTSRSSTPTPWHPRYRRSCTTSQAERRGSSSGRPAITRRSSTARCSPRTASPRKPGPAASCGPEEPDRREAGVSPMTDEEFIAALRGVDSATVANAIEALGVRDPAEGYADLRLRCLVEQREPMVGYAVTVKVDSTTPGLTADRSRLSGLIAAVSQAPKPCVVVCEEAGPAPERGCHMGDVVATMLARNGVVGTVSGSGIRDLAGIRELGLTAFAL